MSLRRSSSPNRRRPVLESLEGRTLLANSVWAFSRRRRPAGLRHATATATASPISRMVGYKTGNVALPNTTGGVTVPVKQHAQPRRAGVDMTGTIQNAINDVSAMSLDANGFRGAVLLTAGNYPISGTLNINATRRRADGRRRQLDHRHAPGSHRHRHAIPHRG